MKTILALLAIVGCALAQASGSQPIPTCEWTSTVIEGPTNTVTLAIPVASASCSMSAFTISEPLSASATPPSASIPPVATGTGYPPVVSSYTGPVINAGAMPTAAPILMGGALGVFALL